MNDTTSFQQGSNRAFTGTPMTPSAASRIQSAHAIAHGGKVGANTFAARAMAAGAKNAKAGRAGDGNRGGGGRGC